MTSGFEKLPTQDEIMAYDPRWITDMQLMYKMYSFFKNDSPLFNIADSSSSFYDDPKNQNKEYDSKQDGKDWAQQQWAAFLEAAEQGGIQIQE